MPTSTATWMPHASGERGEENARNSRQLREAVNERLCTIVIFRDPSRNVTMTVGFIREENDQDA
jgi:hypothetical protein